MQPTGVLWGALGCSEMLWGALGCSEVPWGVLGCPGRSVLQNKGCDVICNAVQVHNILLHHGFYTGHMDCEPSSLYYTQHGLNAFSLLDEI